MTRWDWGTCRAGELFVIRLGASGWPHPRTTAEVEALRILHPEIAEQALAAPWRYEQRVSAAGNPANAGSCAVVASTVADVRLRIHRNDLRRHEPDSPAPAVPVARRLQVVPASSPPHPLPASCERPPERRPWADDERVGSIYVSRQPDGCARVALVMTVDGTARQVQASSGLLPEDVGAAVELCARRLAAEVLRRAPGKTGDT